MKMPVPDNALWFNSQIVAENLLKPFLPPEPIRTLRRSRPQCAT